MRSFHTLFLFLNLVLLSFSCQSTRPQIQLAAKVEGGWNRQVQEPLDPSKRPEWMERLGVQSAQRALYTGPIDVEVFFFELKSSASALECLQLWKKNPSESVMMKDRYFLVNRTQHPNREMLMDFSRALEKGLQ
jgi:hypothetical protein